MTTFPDLDLFEDETTTDTLTLPISGKQYEFRSILPFGKALQFEKMRAEGRRMAAEKAAADAEGREPDLSPSPAFLREFGDFDRRKMYLDLISADMQQQLADDGVPDHQVVHVGVTLFAWHMQGVEVARRVWTRGKLEDADVRPPDDSPASSGGRKTSPKTSTTTKQNASRRRTSTGATTSTGGRSSKRTSTANTRSTSRTRKS